MARGAEAVQQAKTQSQVVYRRETPPFADFLPRTPTTVSYNSFTVDCCCSEHGFALLYSPRRTVSFAVPTTTPTFLPSALSHLRGYVHCVLV